MIPQTQPTLEQRVQNLERQNRRLRWALLFLPIAGLVLAAGVAQVKDLVGQSVTAQKFILIDGDGRERAALFTSKAAEPVLEFYNKDHSLILNAGKSPENGVGFIQFFDSAGKFKGGVGGNAIK
jgi:hypothetical protein